jgi:hypothetical protein
LQTFSCKPSKLPIANSLLSLVSSFPKYVRI